MKVDFMIVGAQKCGTTTLFDILDSHLSIVGSHPKETHFFSCSSNWRKELPEYEKLFKSREDSLYFEASTTYTFYPLRNLRIWDDIFEYNPKMKFIYLVRNPIDRIVSSYMHTYERGYTDLKLEEALIEKRLFIDITRYYTQINPYIKKFGIQNVLIIDFDDFIHHRESVLQEISGFLNIDFNLFKNYQNVHSNVSGDSSKKHHKFDNPSISLKIIRKLFPPLWNRMVDNSKRHFKEKPVLTDEFKEMIINMLELEIIELQKLLNKDLSA